MYNTPRITTIERQSVDKEEAEEAIKKYWNSRKDETLILINSQLEN
jgi:hypothetical protein